MQNQHPRIRPANSRCVASNTTAIASPSSPLRGFLRAFVLFVVSALLTHSLQAQRFDPIAPTFDSPATFRALKSALDANPAEAAATIESLLKSHADDLTRADEQTLLSVPAAIDALEPHKRQKLIAEYRRLYDADAQTAFDAAREEDRTSIESLYAVARRYPLSSIAPRAYTQAAGRAARVGDAPTALALDRLARSAGFKADEAHANLMKSMASLISASSTNFRGPLPFDAPWFSRPDHAGLSRSIPLAHDNTLYFTGPRHVLAMKDTGQLLWRFAAQEQWSSTNTLDRSIAQGRGPTLSAALFASPAAAQVLVVRQPRGFSRDMVLRALRASDGKLLWSTDTNLALENVSFAANPIISGRYVYAAAFSVVESQRTLLLVALDLLDGHVFFKTALGSLTTPPRGAAPTWDAAAEQSEPAIAGDVVYVTPDVGAAYAIDRFDGSIRWLSTYDAPAPEPPRRPRAPGLGGAANRDLPVDPAILLRYRGTPHLCGDVLIIAPQDSASAYALDRPTGRQRWKVAAPPGHTLIAGNDTFALFAGVASITALDSATSQPKWTWNPPAGVRLSGPPAQLADILFIPTSDARTVTLSISTGKPISTPLKPPALKPLLTGPARQAIDDAFLLRSFTALPTTSPPRGTP